MTKTNKYLDVSITKEIVNFLLLAVASYLHAGSAMIKSATIQWIGNSSSFLMFVVSYVLLYTLHVIICLQEGDN